MQDQKEQLGNILQKHGMEYLFVFLNAAEWTTYVQSKGDSSSFCQFCEYKVLSLAMADFLAALADELGHGRHNDRPFQI